MTFKNYEIDSSLMEKGKPSFKLLKRMSQRYPRCQFTMVNDVRTDRCTVASPCYFRVIVNCNDYEPKWQRAILKKAVNTFCELKSDTHSKQNLKLTFSSYLLTCETHEFVLDWEAGKYTLKDITNFQFKDVAMSVQARAIKESYSTFYYIPHNELNFLLFVAAKNLLKQLGVTKLTHSYINIFNKCKRDDVSNIKCLLYVLLIDV